jgi:hypothetical protein
VYTAIWQHCRNYFDQSETFRVEERGGGEEYEQDKIIFSIPLPFQALSNWDS